jgi:hypothetical protein
MRVSLSFNKLFVVTAAVLLWMPVARGDVIYREVFGNTPGASGSQPNTNFDSVGWSAYWSPTAQTEIQGSVITPTTNYNNFGVSDSFGTPVTLTNVNTGSQAASTTNGFAFSSGFLSVSNTILFETSQYTVNQSVWNIGSISFYSGNTSNTFPNGMPGWRIAIQMDGNWYASSQVLVQNNNIASAAAFNTSGQQLVFNWTTAASAWDSLNFVPGTSLVLGSTLGSNLPADPITAFGLYSDPAVNTNGIGGVATRRFDTYEIDGTVIPEPSTVALVFVGLGVLWGLRRSRRA